MRTTIDMPDDLLARIKRVTATRKTTFRSLVIDALERSLAEAPQNFRLRDASAGAPTDAGKKISTSTINEVIDQQRIGSPSPMASGNSGQWTATSAPSQS